MKTHITSISLMLSLMLTACGGSSGSSDTTASSEATAPAETTAPEPEVDGLPEVDMDGFTLSILHHNYDFMTWTKTDLNISEQTGEIVDDAIYSRNERVKERFNCNLEIVGEKSVGASQVSQLVLAGDTTYDIIMQRDYEAAKSATYLMDWYDIPHIAFDKEWWYPEATEVFDFGGKLLAAANSISLSVVSRASGYAFNKDVFDQMGMDKSPFDYVYEDKWTLDNFKLLAKGAYRDINGDAQVDENDRFGFHWSWKENFARFINGSGVSFVSQGSDGYPVFTLDSDETAVNKLLKIFELSNDEQIYKNPETNADGYTGWGDLTKGTALFRICTANTMGTTLRDSDVSYGFVPNPKYDEDQERYYSTTWAFEIMTLPKTLSVERYENVGIILEALAYDSHTSVLEPYKEVAAKIKYTQDDDSLAMLDIVFKSITFDLGIVLWEAPIANTLISEIYASTLAEQKNTINALIDDLKSALEEQE